MKNNKRRKKYLGSAFQKKMLFLVFVAAVIPAAIIAVCMYYLIFSMLAWQMVIPEAIAYNLMPVLKKVNLVIALSVPIILVLLWLVALELSHRVAGPLYRMEKELDEIIAGNKSAPIKLRKKDEFKILADKINKLIAK
jgi:signal transduction histidine kinase